MIRKKQNKIARLFKLAIKKRRRRRRKKWQREICVKERN
jgi:hypothetical protein